MNFDIEQFLLAKKINFVAENLSSYGAAQELPYIVDNIAKSSVIELDGGQRFLLIYPASHDINSNLLRDEFQSLSFAQINLSSQSAPDICQVLLCEGLRADKDLIVTDSEYLRGNKIAPREFGKKGIQWRQFRFSGPKKYKARVKMTAPKKSVEEISQYKKCFLGFSLESKSFQGNRLVAILGWIAHHFDECTILIADAIHRNTIQMDRDIPEVEAEKLASDLGVIAKENCLEIIKSQSRCSFHFVTARELMGHENYELTLKELYSLYSSSLHFRNSVDAFSKNFSHRKIEKRDNFLTLSVRYLLEELAIVRCLVENGPKVLVYPGELNTFYEIAEGKYSDIPTPLKKLVNISLAFRPAGQESSAI